MLEGKYIVGLCATRLDDKIHSDIVVSLNKRLISHNMKLVIYNSNIDFYKKDMDYKNAVCIYDNIDYEYIDVVVIMAQCFRDSEIINRIKINANQNNVPVIIIDGELDGCFSITADYKEAYVNLIEHVIKEHNVKDTVFIGGHNLETDIDSINRLKCYKKALKDCGLAFDNNRVFFGEYWENPTKIIVQNLINSDMLPEAFICANDTMAIAVCEELADKGIKVPDEVKVTGFDGMPIATFVTPQISTCKANFDDLADRCVRIIKSAIKSPDLIIKDNYHYETIIRESCGCRGTSHEDLMESVVKLYKSERNMSSHENFAFMTVNSTLRMTTLDSIYGPVAKMLVERSYMCINGDLADLAHTNIVNRLNNFSNNLIVVSSMYNEAGDSGIRHISLKGQLPAMDKWLNENSIYVLTPVYSSDFICGYYAARVLDFEENYHQVMRVSRLLNISFNSLINQMIQKRMLSNIENAIYLDSTTSLPNLKGATKWFDEFKEVSSNRNQPITFSVYTMPKYSYIYENYGINEIEDIVSFVSDALKEVNKEKCFIARTSDDEFVVINWYEYEEEIGPTIDRASKMFFEIIEEFNYSSAKEYYVEVNCGCSVATAGWDGSFEFFVRHAYSEMYLNRVKYGNKDVIKEKATPREMYSAFCLLMENKLFSYHFQPIIDARTGEIFAYEAVMRTSGGINLSPTSILEIASEYGRLDELEKITLFCILERFEKDLAEFKERKLFVNTIPGHFLSDKDRDYIKTRYADLLDYIIFEVTEQDSISDEELKSIRELQGKSGASQIAIDDYGTGHSNMVNLLRYTPQVIKIDHYLISGVESDSNKQMFIKNTINFAALNKIKVLAEGVETKEELLKVIELGVDLIQGYYTGKPAPQPLEELPSEIKSEIVGENIVLSKYDNEQLVYNAKYGEIINLVDLALAKYTTVYVRGGDITFIGDRDNVVNMVIKVLDNAKTTMTFIDVNIKGAEETTVQLGHNTITKLNLIGVNTLNKEGILVPKSSSLSIVGDGDLTINNNRNYSVGIGTNYHETFGDITINITGQLTIRSSGDRVVGIGGGRGDNSYINLVNGDIDISGKGIKAINIGIAEGTAKIKIGKINIKAYTTGDEAVCIGSINGKAEIVSEANISATCDGERAATIGSINGEANVLKLDSGRLDLVVHCDMGCCIGAVNGSMQFINEQAYINIYGEGSNVCGIGSNTGLVKATISGGEIIVELSAAEYYLIGHDRDSIIINGGNIVTVKNSITNAKNMFGELLERKIIKGNNFTETFFGCNGNYEYFAEKKYSDQLSVYLPVGRK